MLVRALLVLCVFGVAYAADKTFPDIDVLNFYSTEVQLSLVKEEATVYVKQFYDKIKLRGRVSIYMQGDWQSLYYDSENDTYQVSEVNKTHCITLPIDISDYYYTPLYHGWVNKDPVILGPTAPLHYAKGKDVKYIGTDYVRDIPVERFDLKVQDKIDNFTIQYYFARDDWTLPYRYKLLTPIRIRVVGSSSRYTANSDIFKDVDQITDFAYFKNTIEDPNDLLPPIGIGCKDRKKSDSFPDIPNVFKYSADLVNLLTLENHDDRIVITERVWYDYHARLARVDRYNKEDGFSSAFYDIKGGAAYHRQRGGSCRVGSLRNTEFITYDLGMSGRMMNPREWFDIFRDFYSMGKRKIRGIDCDVFESVVFSQPMATQTFHKLVTTIYFIETVTYVGVNGNMESRIPAYIQINGWKTPTDRSFSVQYNIYGFTDNIWPPMYATFGVEKCYTKPETKSYFVMVLEVKKKDAALMEDQDNLIIAELRTLISQHAKVPEHRIPFLKADYKSSGVYVSGAIVERPPALLQFRPLTPNAGPTTTRDPLLKLVEAATLEECSYACIDEFKDFTCKGFFFCNQACFLKSIDPFEAEDNADTKDLGVCFNYIRVERESTNFREAYLAEAMENLETAVLNASLPVSFVLPSGDEETVIVKDIVIGDGPYTGVDAGDKPYSLSIEWRKLDSSEETVHAPIYAATLTECYKRCKDAGSECASFSFCPDSSKDDKECLITPELLVKGKTPDTELVADKFCNIYNPKYSSFFEPFPERVTLLGGDKSIRGVDTLEKCARYCRLEKDFVCRGFEFCRSKKACSLHKKHILDFEEGDKVTSTGECTHYAARFIADYMDQGGVLIDDTSDIRYGTSLDECAKICSEELKEKCKSFNYCPVIDYTDSSCALSTKLLRDDGVTTTEKSKCLHFEKREVVHDWDKNRRLNLASTGYTKKGFTNLVVGMIFLGLIVGVLGFVGYSCIRARSGSGEGMAVRFMKNDA